MHQIVEQQKLELQEAMMFVWLSHPFQLHENPLISSHWFIFFAFRKLFSNEQSSSEQRRDALQSAFETYEKRIEALLSEMTASQNQLKEKDFGGSLDEATEPEESQATN
jgi:hypothetical protein